MPSFPPNLISFLLFGSSQSWKLFLFDFVRTTLGTFTFCFKPFGDAVLVEVVSTIQFLKHLLIIFRFQANNAIRNSI